MVYAAGDVNRHLPQLQHWLIQHWFALTNSLFWLVVGLEAVMAVHRAPIHGVPSCPGS